jgi:M6 family metalloprotease-like protein
MKKLLLLLLLSAFVFAPFAKAAFVTNQPYQVTQPDGNVINCFVSGDEYFNWLHDADGYTIIQASDGYYYYGIRQNDVVVPTQYKVNQVDPRSVNLPKWAKVSKQEYQRRKSNYTANYDNNTSVNAPHLGTMNNISIYIKFSDDTEFTTTRQSYDDLFNLSAGNSLKSYFNEVSYTQFTISTTGYPACAMTTNYSYTDTHPRSYFEPYNATTNPNGYNGDSERTFREHTLLHDAVTWINANSPVPGGLNIDGDSDGQVDNVCFIIRGGNGAWASLLWAHRWALYSIPTYINGKQVWDYTFQPESQVDVQTLCHEMFHALGAPDLYHYDDGGLNISPVSSWDLMESGGGHMGAYMKWKYSSNTWITTIPEITTSGIYTLSPLTSATNNCYKIASTNSASEFFVVEYRKKTGTFENTLPGSGLLVYRIDPSLEGNADGPPDEVYIYRPNGTTSTNGNPWTAYYSQESGRTSINDGTNPSSFLQNGNAGGLNIYNVTSAGNTISFTVGLSTVANPLTFIATPVSTSQIDLAWQKNNSNNNVMLAYSTSSAFGIPQTGTTYSVGNTIPGGGTVIYSGNGTSYSHTSLPANTTYYYKLWSVDGTITYSNGASANATTQCGITSLPYTQLFAGEVFPACWSQQTTGTGVTNGWAASATNMAGGTASEMKSTWQQVNPGVVRLVTPSFNTTGMTQLNLSFRHMLDDYAPGATVRVQSSSNGITWTNEAWSLATVSDNNVGPELINTTITSNLNSPTTYIAFTIEGDLYQYDNWYIDDVTIQNAGSQSFSITTSSNPVAGGTTSGGGNFLTGQSVVVVATPALNWNFLNWTENGNVVSNETSYSFTASANRVLVANFSMNQVTVSTASNPPSGGSTTGSGTYAVGSQVSVTASPATGYEFLNWTQDGNIVSTSSTYTFTTVGSVNLVANFGVMQFTVITSANPIAGGTTTGGGVYSYNASVTVTADASSGWDFTGWYENGTMVSVSNSYTFNALGDHTLEAQFVQQVQVYSISVSANPQQAGLVTGGGTATAGSQITVQATANPDWEFVNWTENGSQVSTNTAYTFTVTGNRVLVANFVQILTITAVANPADGGNIIGAGAFVSGSMVNLQAIANTGFKFYNWTENGNVVSTNVLYSFIASINRSLVANFLSTVDIPKASATEVKIYPNPTDAMVYLETPGSSITKVLVTDPSGRMVFQIFPSDDEWHVSLDLSGLKSGVYAIQITSKNGTLTTRKVVLQK